MVLSRTSGEGRKSNHTMLRVENNGLLPTLLSDLELAVLEKAGRGQFCILGETPDWFGRWFPVREDKTIDSGRLALPGDFVAKAESLWKAKSTGWVHSDPCCYEDCSGDHVYLKVAALRIGLRPLLLLRLLYRRRPEV